MPYNFRYFPGQLPDAAKRGLGQLGEGAIAVRALGALA